MSEEYTNNILEETQKTHKVPSHLLLEEGKLIAYQCMDGPPLIRKAPTEREWMDRAHQKFPYRCLPMVIANQLGWDIINPVTFKAIWNGGPSITDVKITWPSEKTSNLPSTHFGAGTLTFGIGFLFHTPPGVNLLVTGPTNEPKDGIQPLVGLVETDWLPATFTMNWIFTRANHEVVFEAGESFCRIIPTPRFVTEYLSPEIRMLAENRDLFENHEKWKKARDTFNKGIKDPTSVYSKQKWQKDYFKGGGNLWPPFQDHQTRLEQKDFADYRPAVVQERDQKPSNDVRNVSVRIPGRANLNILIPNLDLPDVTKQKRTDHIATLQSSNARGSVTSRQATTPPNLKKPGDGTHKQRRTKELDSGAAVQQDTNSVRSTFPIPEGETGVSSSPREGEGSMDNRQSSDPHRDKSRPSGSDQTDKQASE